MRYNRVRTGFTLVELLVVLAIVGILIGLLLPAVQAARQAARRIQCANNLKQLGLALHNYHSALKKFPPGLNMYTSASCPGVPAGSHYGWSWSTFILPYMEQGAVYEMIDFDVGAYAWPNAREAGASRIRTFCCPSDPYGEEWVDCCTGWSNGAADDEDFRQTNYVGVADSIDRGCGNGIWPRTDGNGMLFNLKPVRVSHVKDGTSNTLFVGEWVGSWGSHSTTGQSYLGMHWISWNIQDTALGINGSGSIPGGRNINVDPIDGDGGDRYAELWDEIGFASYHPGGAHFLLVDGSTQFLNEHMDHFVLAAMTTRLEGEVWKKGL